MHRLPDFARGREVRFTFDGRMMMGFEHESLAAAILVSGPTVLSRSLRFHRPRTVFCSTGECGWCALEVDGVPNVHTCLLKCRDDVIVRSQNAWPSAEWDMFNVLDLISSFLPNTFYHQRFLRPKFMRQFYLRTLRLFTGQGRLRSDGKNPAPKQREAVETSVAVVGGGLAGMSAAVTAAMHGARVILIDDRDMLGGSWRLRRDVSEVPSDLIAKLKDLPNLEYWSHSICIGIYKPRTLGVVTPQRLVTLYAEHIILAPGALDALPLFVNNDLPGVMSARLVERLITAEGIVPGRRAALWGAPIQTQRIIAVMQKAGIEISHELEADEVIVAAKGRKKVRDAVVRNAIGHTRTIPCDLIVIAALQPRNELLAQIGGQLYWDAGGLTAVRDRYMRTSIPGVRVVGETAGSADVNRCLAEGKLAGLSTLQEIGFDDVGDEINLLAEQITRMGRDASILFPSESINGVGHVCFCEDVREREIRAQMGSDYTGLELIKRRTAVVTGPCQGKFCLVNAMRVGGYTTGAPTARPPARPVRMKDLLTD